MFRNKNKKPLPSDNRLTLDAKHTNMIKYFKDLQKSIAEKKKELKEMKAKYAELAKQSNKNLDNTQIQQKFGLAKDIKLLAEEIRQIEERDEETDYYVNTGNLLFSYYDKIDTNTISKIDDIVSDGNNGKVSSQNNNNYDKTAGNSTNSSGKSMNVLDFFNGKINAEADTANSDRADILENYMRLTDPNYIPAPKMDTSYDKCSRCNVELKIVINEGFMVCESCGKMHEIIIESDRPSYKDAPPEISYFAYKRSNHFNEILSQLMGAEQTQIPDDVLDKIMLEIKKERITNMAEVNHAKVRRYLKKLGYNKYYEHIPYIISRLNGVAPVSISPEIIEKLRAMFKAIQGPFVEARNKLAKDRKNFLSYSYILNKFCQLLSLDDLASRFVLLKNKSKLTICDNIWREICLHNRWQFIPSL